VTSAHTSADAVTIMRTVPGRAGERFATKRWIWNHTLNEWRSIAYDAGAFFTVEERPVGSLQDLAAVVEDVRRDPRAFMVRGALTAAVRTEIAAKPSAVFRRRKHARGDAPPTLDEAPRRHLMIDIDNYPLPAWADLADDPEAAIEAAVHDLLPPPFHDAACFWQLSASAGFKAGVLKAHLFFWLAEPISNEDLKTYFHAQAPLVDRALYQAAQPHYTADPIVEGGHDPLPRRTGWRKAMDDVVTLPPLDLAALRDAVHQRRERTAGGAGLHPSAARTIEGALALLGDDDGHEGWHPTLRRATWLYARQTPEKTRDDDTLKEMCRAAIDAAAQREAARQHAGADLKRLKSDAYLDDLIAGAFRLVAENRRDAPEGMRPHHAAPDSDAITARRHLERTIDGFLAGAEAWHAADEAERAPPHHLGLAVDVGTGKSIITRDRIAAFNRRQREAGQPYRALWLVPTIKLGSEAEQHFAGMEDIVVALHRGREQPDPETPGSEMCLDLPAVHLAVGAGENVDEAVCGGRKRRCPFFDRCGYQRQRPDVAGADVVVAAHELAFHLPAALKSGLALTVTDESWWQDGLQLRRTIAVEGLSADPLSEPVLRHIGGGRQVQDDEATNDLHAIRAKVEKALDGAADGYVTRASLVAAGLTVEGCREARRLEWHRKRENLMRPGMSLQARKEAAAQAGVNAQLPRFAALWTALADLLASQDEATGRAEVEVRATPEGRRRVVNLHTRRDVADAVLERPILLLDATMPADLVRAYLPALEVAAPVRVQAPYMRVQQVVGGFGKTTLIPHGDPDTSENRRRRSRCGELRDFVAGTARGKPALVVTYEALEDTFAGLLGVETGHFNAIAGHDRWRGVDHLYVIGRPLPAPDDIRQIAAALTGRPIEIGGSHKEARAVRMRDGTGAAIEVRAYADPTAEAVRAAITDAEVVQAVGRARGINRTAANPVHVWILADVVTPLVVDRLHQWRDLAPGPVERMACRGILFTSPADAAAMCPDLFGSEMAARKALHLWRKTSAISVPFPYGYSLLGEWHRNQAAEVAYRPHGRGQQVRRAWVRPDCLEGLRERLEAVLGPLVVFEVPDPPPQPRKPEPMHDKTPPPTGRPPPRPSPPPPPSRGAVRRFQDLCLRLEAVRPPGVPPTKRAGPMPAEAAPRF